MYLPRLPNDDYSSNDFYKKSFYSRLKRPSNDDEQIVRSDALETNQFQGKRRSTNLASPSSSLVPIETQQQTSNPTMDESPVGVPSRYCSVCGDISTGIHFGGNSCESCKAFFRRSVQCHRYQNYKCSNEERCPVNLITRKVCQFCRYTKCTTIGMKPKWVLSDQEREEKYGARRKRSRQNPVSDEDPDIYKYLTKEEKALVEDIAHALYQSRATYPLQFPSQLTQYLKLLASGVAPPTPPTASATSEKPPNPSANFLIVPIRRLVLFARMLKDFDLFSEDDKVNLLKGSAIEVIVCSSNTLFNPKTHTFTNYLSRDQRAVMDEQVIPLDPLLMKLWGIELFHKTKGFLISMCNLHVDEVTSTLLVPVLLFSPDRSNIKDLDLVKRFQIKYVTLLRKYMNWRYGNEKTEIIYPKLLLQIVNIRSLSLDHAEIIQKAMSTSSVDPLVKEVTAKQEHFHKPTTDRINSLSIASTPSDSNITEGDRTPSPDVESTMGSDEEEVARKKSRPSIDDDDSNETNLTNIWRKRRKLSAITPTEMTSVEQTNPTDILHNSQQQYLRSTSTDYEKHPMHNYPQRRPHDHQVPNFAPTYPDDLMLSNRGSSFRHLPPKKQSLMINRDPIHEQMYSRHSASAVDLSTYDHFSRSNPTQSPVSRQYYPDNSYDPYRQPYPRMSPATYQQDQNEQHLLHLSLVANNQSPAPSNHSQSHPATPLDADEQQLLDAIHAHPNKRDLVLNLLRQMNETSSSQNSPSNSQNRSDSSANYHPHQRN